MNKKIYRELVRDTLLFVKEEARTKKFLLVSPESHHYFRTSSPKKVISEPVKEAVFTAPARHPAPAEKPSPPPVASAEPKPKSKPVPLPMEEWRKSLARHFPSLALADTPPDDARAKEIASRWKRLELGASVLLLSFGEEELPFLKNLAKAIHTQLKPTKILDALALEKEKKWALIFQMNKLDLVIAEEEPLIKMPELKRLLEPATALSVPLLAKTPLILLTPDVKKDKAALWKKICHLLKS